MRFEIRAGGAVLILLGLAGLSGAVFALGLVAGYEMARETAPDLAKAESVYPLPSPPETPEASPSPAAAMNPPGSPAATPGTKLAVQSAEPPSRPAAAAQPSPASAPPALAAAHAAAAPGAPRPRLKPAAETHGISSSAGTPPAETPPPPSLTPAPSEAAAPAAATGVVPAARAGGASAGAPLPHRRPFNIQIDAVMDRTNAEQMAARLQKLGYHAFLVPTDIDGRTWWRVRVGPYDSEEEATAAEQRLRQQYRDAEGGGQ